MLRNHLLTLTLIAAILAPPAQAQARAPRSNAYALVVGSNRAGPGQKTLRYAHEDARRIVGVLTHIGGYSRHNIRLVLDPGPADLETAFLAMRARLAAHAARGEESLFLFFYSGHARARALNLGPHEVALKRLRQRLGDLPSTVTIAILDACQTGAISRIKGTTPAADFSYNSVSSLNTAGLAVLASSASNELSQETDALRSSYFTHNLVVGLRGAADDDNDGGVTLSEAYRYAYNRTLVATAATAVGKQHVTLETKLRGKGEMVLTYPARADSSLDLPAPMAAQVLVHRQPGQSVVAELAKARGKRIRLALPHGSYVAYLRRPGQTGALRCEVKLPRGKRVALVQGACVKVRQAPGVTAKGPRYFHRFSRWALEAGVGVMIRGTDEYNDRLESFAFEEGGFLTEVQPAISAALSYSFNPNLSLVLGWHSLEFTDYSRDVWDLQDKGRDQKFSWWGHAIGVYARGTLPLFEGILNPYAQAGVGLAWATTKYTDHLQASTEIETETQVGFHLGLAAGVNVMPWKHLGFYTQANYNVAPAMENLLGESHDVGGPSFMLGVRGAL